MFSFIDLQYTPDASRSRYKLSNEYLIAKFGDPSENGPVEKKMGENRVRVRIHLQKAGASKVVHNMIRLCYKHLRNVDFPHWLSF